MKINKQYLNKIILEETKYLLMNESLKDKIFTALAALTLAASPAQGLKSNTKQNIQPAAQNTAQSFEDTYNTDVQRSKVSWLNWVSLEEKEKTSLISSLSEIIQSAFNITLEEYTSDEYIKRLKNTQSYKDRNMDLNIFGKQILGRSDEELKKDIATTMNSLFSKLQIDFSDPRFTTMASVGFTNKETTPSLKINYLLVDPKYSNTYRQRLIRTLSHEFGHIADKAVLLIKASYPLRDNYKKYKDGDSDTYRYISNKSETMQYLREFRKVLNIPFTLSTQQELFNKIKESGLNIEYLPNDDSLVKIKIYNDKDDRNVNDSRYAESLFNLLNRQIFTSIKKDLKHLDISNAISYSFLEFGADKSFMKEKNGDIYYVFNIKSMFEELNYIASREVHKKEAPV